MLFTIRRYCAAAVAVAAALLCTASPAAAVNYQPISGAGSTWSSNAMLDWTAKVKQYGMRVEFAATGSSDGRNQFASGTVDFGVSEIPYGLRDGGVLDSPPHRQFAYMPIVAGGTGKLIEAGHHFQESILAHIFRVGGIAGQPERTQVQARCVRQDQLGKRFTIASSRL